MKDFVRFLTLSIVVVLGTTCIAHAGTAVSPAIGTYSFRTELTDARYPRAGAFEGVLNVTVARDGILSGFYRSNDTSRIETVSGGLDGQDVWFDIGSHDLHISGTFENGHIVGVTQLANDGTTYRFEAFPQSKHI